MRTPAPRPAVFLLASPLLGWGCGADAPPGATAPGGAPEPFALVDHVDPRIGTGGIGFAVGCGFPGASWPNGLVSLSPDTADASGLAFGAYRGGGYHADDVSIQGFSHMHLYAVGLTDYGYIAWMPVDGMTASKTTEEGYRAPMDKATEQAVPGRYDVSLTAPEVDVALAATPHTGVHRYRFAPSVDAPTLLIDLGHVMQDSVVTAAEITVEPGTGRVHGWMTEEGGMTRQPLTIWFDGDVSPPPVAVGVWSEAGVLQPGETTATAAGEGTRLGAWLTFDVDEVDVQVGISATDAAGAQTNLEAQRVADVEEAAAAGFSAWDDTLGVVEAAGGTDEDRVIFSTAAYHSRLMPTQWSDADGRYRGFDDAIHQSEVPYYTDFSLWDTYRTLHPLLTAWWPEVHAPMLDSLGRMAEQGGGLPRWPLATWDGGFMVGTPATIVLAEAALKGLPGWSPDGPLDHALALALGEADPPYGRPPDVTLLDTHGYYPADLVGRSVANTQEVAISDFALGLALEARGADPAVVAHLLARGATWENLYDPATGFIHGRDSNGEFEELGNVELWDDDYAEGNALQYRWMAPHVPERLVEVLGGPEAVEPLLTELFEEAALDAVDDVVGLPEVWYWHGNEVDLHAPWLFSYIGRPDLTRQWVGWVWDTWYDTTPAGIAGNDDGGTLSAWALWAAMGLYPLAGTDRYVLGEPRFPELTVPFGPDHRLTIRRLGAGPITEVRLDGAPVDGVELAHGVLVGASLLEFDGR